MFSNKILNILKKRNSRKPQLTLATVQVNWSVLNVEAINSNFSKKELMRLPWVAVLTKFWCPPTWPQVTTTQEKSPWPPPPRHGQREIDCFTVNDTQSQAFELNFTLKVKVNHHPKTIGFLTKVFCILWFKPDDSSSNSSGVIAWKQSLH